MKKKTKSKKPVAINDDILNAKSLSQISRLNISKSKKKKLMIKYAEDYHKKLLT